MSMWEIIGQVFILAGVVLFATAGIGLFRFYDVYTRISAVGTAAGLGIALVVIGALCIQPGVTNAVKVVFIVFFQLTTSAVATAAIARSAFLSQAPLRRLIFDELTPTEPVPGDAVAAGPALGDADAPDPGAPDPDRQKGSA